MPVREQKSFWKSLGELYELMPRSRRRQLYSVFAISIAGAFAELATIGAVLPFLSLLANRDGAEHLPWLAPMFGAVGANGAGERAIVAALLFAALAIVAGCVRLQLVRSNQRFMFGLSHDFNVEIQRRVLLQPYSFHITQNTSRIVASLEKVQTLVLNVLLQLLQASTAAVIALFIIAALALLDPMATFAAAAAFALIYLVVSLVFRRRLATNSKIVDRTWDERVKLVQESLGGVRDLMLDNSQRMYLDAFANVNRRFNVAQANTAFLAAAPRFAIESAGMVVIAGVAVVIAQREGGLAAALPILGALALGAQRLLPLIQQIYSGWTFASGYRTLVTEVLELLRLPITERDWSDEGAEPLPLRDRISIRNVSFTYPGREEAALADITLDIPRGRSIALIGRTGSGKSTLADLLMGLLEPTEGSIAVDGEPLTADSRRRWQKSIAHVPQAIFLADASVARNIAFGVPPDKIDHRRVEQAARTAEIHEFVISLPDGYDTHVGERGIRLSGGQRQRLGIARAIYNGAPVLVLDEATSALDYRTEAAVMKALEAFSDEGRTIVIIAHRLSTVAGCDFVARLDQGRIADFGSYTDVVSGKRRRAAARIIRS